ncbi:MAG: ribosome biogenesis GTP-binding protein YihA/YsxC, partial [Pseudorhodoplanes sp.]|nr:ribosome biogenesis GTP-binding protein YihA/YsxC [Pseudorhodoplanes sp.]
TPGRTQELIYFGNDGALRLVDMPGYGYAEAPKAKVAEWTKLIHAYLKGRANLARVYVLVDARHGLKESDQPALEALGEAAVSHQIVLTKTDELKAKELEDRLSTIGAVISKRAAAFPDILVTSALKGQGIPELRAAIARLVAERKR